MELAIVRHISKEIEAGNGVRAVLMANEQLEPSHPLQRAFIFKAKQTSKMSADMATALCQGLTLRELPASLLREAHRSRFSLVAQRSPKVLSDRLLRGRFARSAACRQDELTVVPLERRSVIGSA